MPFYSPYAAYKNKSDLYTSAIIKASKDYTKPPKPLQATTPVTAVAPTPTNYTVGEDPNSGSIPSSSTTNQTNGGGQQYNQSAGNYTVGEDPNSGSIASSSTTNQTDGGGANYTPPAQDPNRMQAAVVGAPVYVPPKDWLDMGSRGVDTRYTPKINSGGPTNIRQQGTSPNIAAAALLTQRTPDQGTGVSAPGGQLTASNSGAASSPSAGFNFGTPGPSPVTASYNNPVTNAAFVDPRKYLQPQ